MSASSEVAVHCTLWLVFSLFLATALSLVSTEPVRFGSVDRGIAFCAFRTLFFNVCSD